MKSLGTVLQLIHRSWICGHKEEKILSKFQKEDKEKQKESRHNQYQ